MNLYRLKNCQKLIEQYVYDFNGQCTIIEEGVLGLGTVMLHGAENKKTIIIKEQYLNAWSSAHSIRMYNKTPKKYEKFI